MNIERDSNPFLRTGKSKNQQHVTNSNRNYGGGDTHLTLCDEKAFKCPREKKTKL
jgi:hypothetical protein